MPSACKVHSRIEAALDAAPMTLYRLRMPHRAGIGAVLHLRDLIRAWIGRQVGKPAPSALILARVFPSAARRDAS